MSSSKRENNGEDFQIKNLLLNNNLIHYMRRRIIEKLKKIKPLYTSYRFIKEKIHKKEIDIDFPDGLIKRNDIRLISEKYPNIKILIETGTFFGDTLEFFKSDFAKLYSIELSEALAKKARKRFQYDTNIEIIEGDSSVQLSNILSNINSPCLFWLDGHYSTEFWVGDEYIKTAKGDKNTPILKELKQIMLHEIKNHVILIDDARLFNGKGDYPSIKKLKNFVSMNLPKHSFEILNIKL